MGFFFTTPVRKGARVDYCDHDTRPVSHTNSDGSTKSGAYCILCGNEWFEPAPKS